MEKRTLLLAFIILITMLSVTWAQQKLDKGAEIIKLNPGGAMAEVAFPHHIHQNVVNDCNSCHSAFSMSSGIIREKIVRQELRKQQVMNGICLECHKGMKNAGRSTGPVICNQCHIRT